MSFRDPFHPWLAQAEQRYLADLTRAELGPGPPGALVLLRRATRKARVGPRARRPRQARGVRALLRPLALPHGKASRTKSSLAPHAAPHPQHPKHPRAPAAPESTREHPAAPESTCEHPRAPVSTGRARPRMRHRRGWCGVGAGDGRRRARAATSTRGRSPKPSGPTARSGVRGTARRGDVAGLRLPSTRSTILAAFVINELPAAERAVALERLVDAARRGHRVVIVEPISKKLTPWWGEWERAFHVTAGHTRSGASAWSCHGCCATWTSRPAWITGSSRPGR